MTINAFSLRQYTATLLLIASCCSFSWAETLKTAPVAAPNVVAPKPSQATAALVGEIREAGTRERLSDIIVQIQIGEFTQETLTDEKGRFKFSNLPPGKAQIVAVSSVIEKYQTSENLEKRIETFVKLYVKKSKQDPYETVVRARKESKEVTKRVLSRDEFSKVPGSLGGDPIRAVQNLPGVARAPLLGGFLIVRGAAPSSSTVYIDGMQLPNLYHFAAGPSVLPERLIDEVTFYPGGFSVRYGRATAGIIDVKSANPEPKEVHGKVTVDVGGASAYVEVPLPRRTTLVLGFRRSYIDALLPLFSSKNADGSSLTLSPVYYDFQLRLTHRTRKVGEFSFFFYGSDDRLKFARPPTSSTNAFNPSEFKFNLIFYSFQPSWTWKITPQLTQRLTTLFTYKLTEINTPSANFELYQGQFSAREEIDYAINKQFKLLIGAEAVVSFNRIGANVPIVPQYRKFPAPPVINVPTTPINVKEYIYNTAAYAELDASFLNGKLKWTPGLRVEQNGYIGRMRQSLQPRTSFRAQLHRDVSLKAMVGWYQKLSPGQFIFPVIGNPDLDLESALQSSVGAEWQATSAISLDGSVFYNYLWGGPSLTSDVQVKNGNIEPIRYRNEEQGRVFGAEILLRHKPYKGFFGWLAYTVSRSERINPITKSWRPFDFDQTHILTLVASYKLPYGFQIGARFRLVSGNPTNSVQRSVFDLDANRYSPVSGLYNSDRLPLFHQLDLRLDKKFTFKTWQFSLYADVQNVYNQSNAEFFQYSFDYSQRQFFPSLPIVPFVGFEAEF